MRLTTYSCLKRIKNIGVVPVIIMGLVFLITASADAAYTVTPNTWNIIGLDSNTPGSGPNRFPVGAKICSSSVATNVSVSFTWDSGGTSNDDTYIKLRTGSLNPVTIPSIAAGGCADAYFEVEVNPISASFDQTRRYHITAGGVSTPTPRELYVEHLVSQSRNGIDDVKLNGVSIPAGGSMNLMVGNTYEIKLYGHTAPGGYNQFEEFINFPNTIFLVQSVSTTYSSEDSPYVNGAGHPQLYADACRWENDPNSPSYRSCWEDWKAGNTVITTYTVKIVSGGGTSETLNSLLYDFSGSSFHYNADYSTGARIANVIDPTNAGISKSFSPNPTNVNGVSALTFTLTNPNAGAISGYNFTDPLPSNMTVANPPGATATGCGTPTFSPAANDTFISFSNGTIAGNGSCVVKVNVTTSSTGSYTNTTNNLFVDALDTGKSATAGLIVNSDPPPGTGLCSLTMAQWTFAGFSVNPPPFPAANTQASNVASAVITLGQGLTAEADTSVGNAAPSMMLYGWLKATAIDPATSPYVQFAIDTRNYTAVGMRFDAERKANGPNNDAVYYSTDGTNWTLKSTFASTTSWATYGPYDFTGVTSTTGVTYFRIYGNGANATSKGNDINIDNVTFSGCGAPVKPTISKSFSPNPVAVNGTSTLTFTLTNTNSTQLTGAKFTDVLPAGLEVAATPSATTTCTGSPTWAPAAGATTLDFGQTTGGNIPGSGSCTVSVNIKATTAGPHNNVSGFLSTTEGGTNTNSVASASLTAVLPPVSSKLFSQNPILAGETSTLTFTITNPNQNDALSGVAFTDTFPTSPGAMTVASPLTTSNTCGGALLDNLGGALAAGDPGISLNGGTVSAGGSCTITVNVTAPAIGTYSNTSGAVSATTAGSGNTASDTLTVSAPHPAISILKQVSKNAVGPWTTYISVTTGANVYYRFTVENVGDVDLTSVSVTDPAFGGTVCSPGNLAKYATVTCTAGPVAAVSGFNFNTATAHGFYGVTEYTDLSIAAYATTGLTIVKSATQTYFTAAGNVLNYSYVVKNTGYAPLLGPVTVSDDKATVTCPAVSTSVRVSDGVTAGDGDNYLDGMIANAEQITCTATYTVTAVDVTAKLVTNVASATIDGVTSPSGTKTVPLAAEIVVTKANDVGGTVALNGTFKWTLTVTNSASSGSTATYSDTQVILTDDLPAAGATYIVPASATNTGGTSGTVSCAVASNTLTCAASGGAVTIPPGGSFSIEVTVTATALGSLVNPKSGGTCKADSSALVPEIDETNNDCAPNTVTVVSPVSLTATKSVQTYSDPINGTSTPRAIPGSFMTYTIEIQNTGAGTVDNNTTVITDQIPANAELFVGDINGAGSGPLLFTDGSIASGLSYGFINLASAVDNISFSNDNGSTYNYTPVPDANQCDTNVTNLKVSLNGIFNGTNASFDVKFRVRVK